MNSEVALASLRHPKPPTYRLHCDPNDRFPIGVGLYCTAAALHAAGKVLQRSTGTVLSVVNNDLLAEDRGGYGIVGDLHLRVPGPSYGRCVQVF